MSKGVQSHSNVPVCDNNNGSILYKQATCMILLIVAIDQELH